MSYVPKERTIVAVDVKVFGHKYLPGVFFRWCTLSCGHRSTVAAWRPFGKADCPEHNCKGEPHE